MGVGAGGVESSTSLNGGGNLGGGGGIWGRGGVTHSRVAGGGGRLVKGESSGALGRVEFGAFRAAMLYLSPKNYLNTYGRGGGASPGLIQW